MVLRRCRRSLSVEDVRTIYTREASDEGLDQEFDFLMHNVMLAGGFHPQRSAVRVSGPVQRTTMTAGFSAAARSS